MDPDFSSLDNLRSETSSLFLPTLEDKERFSVLPQLKSLDVLMSLNCGRVSCTTEAEGRVFIGLNVGNKAEDPSCLIPNPRKKLTGLTIWRILDC
jgi:hypothetical protein